MSKIKQEEHRRNMTSRDHIRTGQLQFIERKRVYREQLVKTLEQDTQEKIHQELGVVSAPAHGTCSEQSGASQLCWTLRAMHRPKLHTSGPHGRQGTAAEASSRPEPSSDQIGALFAHDILAASVRCAAATEQPGAGHDAQGGGALAGHTQGEELVQTSAIGLGPTAHGMHTLNRPTHSSLRSCV